MFEPMRKRNNSPAFGGTDSLACGKAVRSSGLLLALILAGAGSADAQPKTYCNPINIDYTYSIVNAHQGLSYRSGADPSVIEFRDRYYLFVTRSFGYWRSDDLSSWEFIRPQSWYFESSNAPAAWPLGDSLVIATGNPSGRASILYTGDPDAGTWKGAPSIVPHTLHDPALFADDDGRVYIYEGSSNVHPIMGAELNPGNHYLPAGEFRDLINLDPEKHGWERFGDNHLDTATKPFIEGPWMNKHNGKYYLQYAAPGTQWNVYGDGVYTSDDPLGPFTYEEYSPFSYKPGGFINGAGHGSTMQDRYGNYWHFGTMALSVNYNFERRIGQFPAGFDEDGQLYTNTAYGDYPHYVPDPENPDRDDWFTGWMLLSYEKPVQASSVHEDFKPEYVTDENIKTFWVAENERGLGDWLVIDLEEESEVRALQINYFDYQSDIYGKPDTLYHQYLIESSSDGTHWEVMVDKRENKEDVPNDYVALPQPRKARYIRFTNYHVPTPHLAISGLRVFGKGAGDPPRTPENFRVRRGSDRREASLSWNPVPGGQGYHLYYGIAPDKLYNSVLVYKNTGYQLRGLNVNPGYFFKLEAFNENGISGRTGTVAAD